MLMECTETHLTYLMSFVPEKDIASYFTVIKNHVLSNIMMGILIHILENGPMPDYWPHSEHSHLIKLEKKNNSLALYLVLKTPAILEAGLVLWPSQFSLSISKYM